MKKKGFTLIELLAIIGILAVVSLIAVPIVLGILKNARKNSYHRTVDYVEKSAELFHKNNFDAFNKSVDANGKYTDRLLFSCKDTKCITTTSGEINTFSFTASVGEGYLVLYRNGTMEYALTNNEFCVTKLLTDKKSTITEGNCADISLANDVTPPIIESLSSSSTSKSIKVIINARDNESGILGYSCSIDGVNYSEMSDSPICEYQNLETGKYIVYVKVYNNNYGQEGTTDKETVSDDSIEVATIPIDMPEIIVNPKNDWAQAKVVTIKESGINGVSTYYSIDDVNNWIEGNTVVVTENDTEVFAKYSDGVNTVQASSYMVNKVDRTAPTLVLNVSFAPKMISVNSVASDSQSGIYGYQFGISSDGGVSWQMSDIQQENTYVFRNLNVGIHDVKVITYNNAYNNTNDEYKNYELGTKTEIYPGIVATNCSEPIITLDDYNFEWVQYRTAKIDYGNIKECIGSYAIYDDNNIKIDSGNTSNVKIETNNTIVKATNTSGDISSLTTSRRIVNIDSTAPTSSTNAIDLIDHGIHIVAYGYDAESDIAMYSFSIDNGTTWTDWQESNIYTFNNLALTSYPVKTRVWNGTFGSPGATIGKGVLESTTTTVTVGSCTPPTFTFVNNDANIWTQSKMIKINKPNGFTASYKLDSSNTFVDGDTVNITVNGQEITAKVSDGVNVCNATNSLKVVNIDRTAPTVSVHSSIKKSVNENTIIVVAAGYDLESDIAMYNFSKDGGATWTGWQSEKMYEFTNLVVGTYYFKTKVYNGTYGTVGATEEYGVLESDTSIVDIAATCPVPEFTFTPTTEYAQSRTVTIDYGDVVGCIGTYSKDGGSYQSGNTVVFTDNGYVTARNVNSAGVIVDDTLNLVGIDSVTPTATLSLSSGGSAISSGDVVSSKVVATLNCTTTGESGIASYYMVATDSSNNTIKSSTSSTLNFTPSIGENTITGYCTSGSGMQSNTAIATVTKQSGYSNCTDVKNYCSSQCAGVVNGQESCKANCTETVAANNGLECPTSTSDSGGGSSSTTEYCMAGGGYPVSGIAEAGDDLCGGQCVLTSCDTPSGITKDVNCCAPSGATCSGTPGGYWSCTCSVLCQV